MSRSIRLLGIDPGFGRCGWGVLNLEGNHLTMLDCGVIETSPKLLFPERLLQLHEALHQVIETFAPDEAAIEELFFAKNVKTAINVGQARGVIVLTCCQNKLPVAEYKPVEIKMAVSGYGAAAKNQIQRMVKMVLGLQTIPKSDDAADALAVAICHAHSRTQRNLSCKSENHGRSGMELR